MWVVQEVGMAPQLKSNAVSTLWVSQLPTPTFVQHTQLVIRFQRVILTINIQSTLNSSSVSNVWSSTLNLWNTTVKYNHIRQTGELCSTHLLPTNHILLQTSDINNIQMFYIQYSTVYEFGLGRSACNLSCPGHHTYLFKPHSMLIKLV